MSASLENKQATTDVEEPETTYFGLPVVKLLDGKVVRFSDIEKLPFFEFWLTSSAGSTLQLLDDGDKGVNLNDWISFSRLFIQTGNHRYSKESL